MRASRPAEQALRLATSSASQKYVCRACRAQAARQFHTSVPRPAQVPLYQRLRDTLFGSKQSQEAEKGRGEKQVQRREEEQQQSSSQEDGALEVVVGRDGQEYEVAAVVDPTLAKNYIQAMSWEGLERIGSEEWVKRRADQGEQYVGFIPKKDIKLTPKQWKIVLSDIMADILALKRAGRSVDQVLHPNVQEQGTANETWTPDSGLPSFSITKQQSLRVVANERQYRGTLGRRSKRSTIAPIGDVSLHDPAIKLALHKIILRVSGRRISDAALNSSHTLSDLYSHLTAKTKSPSLARAPEIRRLKATSAANVSFVPRKVTMIDREKQVGRWKVIEEELVARGLPVTGSRFQGAKTVVH
ncbi:hypothetical protein LTR78_007100 [Recurvomyces mirabilis]|uniref:Large ribosomal subunit protein mL50 n=1 Tax=Recurvomyces mirabilis TaxID=574656 RepID=A0AAE0WJR6_9PEZI|nr:hypothetical protein LTR78_007100 [Recurvomyces mirabilis]KAK5150929.1 hypothetical protein LTS14_009732 [Recurvomyces mirabilis]